MKFAQRILIAGCCFACVLASAAPTFAQKDARVNIDRLERYEVEWLKGGANTPTYEKLISDERTRIRALLEKDVNDIVQPPDTAQDLVPTKAIDRQRQIVADLTGRLNEDTVDLNLLKDEEKLYKQGVTGSGASDGKFMMTQSYPELLAKRVVLEEDIDLVTSALSPQDKRLQKFLAEQRTESTGLLLTILEYLAIVFVVVWVEHFVRTQLILRIPHRGLRYSVAKVFTLLLYVSLLFWLAERIFADYPGLGTVLAVIGAALVFMLQDVIKSILGWLTYKGALKLGQRVTLGGYTGDVLDISMLYTTMIVSRSPEMDDVSQVGKLVRVPNSQLLIGNLVNFHSTSDFENVEIPLVLADSRQWEHANEVLDEVLSAEMKEYTRQAQRQMDKRMRGYYFSQVSPAHRVYMEMEGGNRLTFQLCFPVPIGQRRVIATQLLQKILKRFEQEHIGLASAKE